MQCRICKTEFQPKHRRHFYCRRDCGGTGYRKTYGKFFGPIPKGWVVYHIDGEHRNNNPDNLIAIPHKVYIAIHNRPDLLTREEIESILS